MDQGFDVAAFRPTFNTTTDLSPYSGVLVPFENELLTAAPTDGSGVGGDDLSSAVARTIAENRDEFLGFLERRVGSRALAEDLYQDAFVRSLDRVDTLRDEGSTRAWFYRTLRNAIIDHYRREAAQGRLMNAFAQELEVQQQADDTMDAAICTCIAAIAQTLKPEYAHAIQRIDVDELSVKQFAEEAGISASNAGVRVFRAREALRKRVATSCGACATHGCVDCTCGSRAS